MKVLMIRSSHKNSNSKKRQSQFSFIFVLDSQYRSQSVLLSSAVHCPRWFLCMGSRRLHSMQWGSGRIPMRWRRVPKQSWGKYGRNSANCLSSRPVWFFWGAISCFHGLWNSLVSSSCLCTLWDTCLKCSLKQVFQSVNRHELETRLSQSRSTSYWCTLGNVL